MNSSAVTRDCVLIDKTFLVLFVFLLKIVLFVTLEYWRKNIDVLMQERRKSIDNALALHLSCTNLSIWKYAVTHITNEYRWVDVRKTYLHC